MALGGSQQQVDYRCRGDVFTFFFSSLFADKPDLISILAVYFQSAGNLTSCRYDTMILHCQPSLSIRPLVAVSLLQATTTAADRSVGDAASQTLFRFT